MDALNIQTQHVTQVVCAFLSDPVPLNVTKSFHNTGINVIVDENHLCCKVIPGLVRCLFNPGSLQPFPIPEETEDEATETDMELYVDECYDLLYDLDTPNEEDEWEDIK
jgi:hypothetical protein